MDKVQAVLLYLWGKKEIILAFAAGFVLGGWLW